MSLTTFRKSGVAVATPVWFAQDGNRLVMTTSTAAGKIKRIRNNPRVTVAPSDMRGKVLGDAVSAQAGILQGDEAVAAEKLLKRNTVCNGRCSIYRTKPDEFISKLHRQLIDQSTNRLID